jgi:ABC-type nitrate/sulfonate/bicarbonate transport system substrate-binding protein
MVGEIMKKMYFIITGIILVLILAILVISLTIKKEESALKIGYSIDSVSQGPIILAMELGLFKKYDLNIVSIPLKGGKEIRESLAIGQIDIGATGAAQFFIPISKGAPIKIISFLTNSPTQVYVRPNDITKFSELEGKSITSRIGSSTNLIVMYVLNRENVDLNKINFIDLDKLSSIIALMNKKIIDFAIAGDYEESLFLNAGAVLFEDWNKKGYSKETYPKSVIAINTNYLKNNPEFAKKFIFAIIDSEKYIKEHPNEAAKILSESITRDSGGAVVFSQEDILETWKTTKYILWDDPSVLMNLAKISKDIGDIKDELTTDQIFDSSFQEVLENAQAEIYN